MCQTAYVLRVTSYGVRVGGFLKVIDLRFQRLEDGGWRSEHSAVQPLTSNLKPEKNQFSGKKLSTTRNTHHATRNGYFNLDRKGR